MDLPNLARIDLNLLLVLDALLIERHVTRAGERAGLSQPATSNALKRLRVLLDDPLLVRSGNSMELTERARQLQTDLRPALEALHSALDTPDPFDPGTCDATIRVATTDHVMLRVLPGLQRQLSAEAPAIRLDFQTLGVIDGPELLRRNDLDVLIGVYRRLDPTLRRARCFDEDTVALMRSGHPVLQDAPLADDHLTEQQLFAHQHLRIAPTRDDPGAIARAIGARSKARHVALTVPNYLPAPYVVAETDLIVVLSRSVADLFARQLELVVRPISIDLPLQEFDVIWHPRHDDTPHVQWLISTLQKVP